MEKPSIETTVPIHLNRSEQDNAELPLNNVTKMNTSQNSHVVCNRTTCTFNAKISLTLEPGTFKPLIKVGNLIRRC